MDDWGLVQAKKSGKPKDEPFFAKEILLSETQVINFSLCPRNTKAIKLVYPSENNSPDDLPTALSS